MTPQEIENELARLWRAIEMIIDHLDARPLDDALWRLRPEGDAT